MGGVEMIRPMTAAGRFYDADVSALRQDVETFCADVPASKGRIRGLIAPHAGYVYSGRVAGMAYGALRLQDPPPLVLLMGPSHHTVFRGVARPGYTVFSSPMGEHPVRRIQAGEERDEVHAPEHALETHLPFLSHCCGPVPIVPWVTGNVDPAEVADAVIQVLDAEPRTLLAVSSDLSHFHEYAEAKRRDAWTTAAIEEGRWQTLGSDDACGHVAISALLIVARRFNWRIQRRMLCNSGDATGSKAQVVGYGSWLLTEDDA